MFYFLKVFSILFWALRQLKAVAAAKLSFSEFKDDFLEEGLVEAGVVQTSFWAEAGVV